MATITARSGKTLGRELDVLGELHRLETGVADAVERTGSLRSEHTRRFRLVFGYPPRDQVGLMDELRKVLRRDPSQFQPDGTPVSKTSDAGKLQAQVDELTAGMPELLQEAEHAERLETQARLEFEAFIFEHGQEIFAAMRPQGETIAAETNESAREFERELHAYMQFCQRMVGLVNVWNRRPGANPVPNKVTGVEAATDFWRVVQTVDLPAPELG